MKTQQSGFTLIELVMVIVVIGILAAVAIPKYVNLTDESVKAKLDGYAGALGSASAVNYAGCAALNNVVTADKCVKMTKCSDVGLLLQPSLTLVVTATTDGAPYLLTTDTAASTTNGTGVVCTLNAKMGTGTTASATYTVIGAGN